MATNHFRAWHWDLRLYLDLLMRSFPWLIKDDCPVVIVVFTTSLTYSLADVTTAARHFGTHGSQHVVKLDFTGSYALHRCSRTRFNNT